MGFGEAIKTVFGKYATFEGRARRSEFWYWVLFLIILQVISNILDNVLGTTMKVDAGSLSNGVQGGWISAIVALVLIIPTISVGVRRLHDIDRSGWWWWIGVICCIGGIILLIFHIQPGTVGPNRFGPDPKGGVPAA